MSSSYGYKKEDTLRKSESAGRDKEKLTDGSLAVYYYGDEEEEEEEEDSEEGSDGENNESDGENNDSDGENNDSEGENNDSEGENNDSYGENNDSEGENNDSEDGGDSEDESGSSGSSSSHVPVEAHVKQIYYRSARGTRIKQLIEKYDEEEDDFWRENKYFGKLADLYRGSTKYKEAGGAEKEGGGEEEEDDDGEYVEDSSGRDYFDSDFEETPSEDEEDYDQEEKEARRAHLKESNKGKKRVDVTKKIVKQNVKGVLKYRKHESEKEHASKLEGGYSVANAAVAEGLETPYNGNSSARRRKPYSLLKELGVNQAQADRIMNEKMGHWEERKLRASQKRNAATNNSSYQAVYGAGGTGTENGKKESTAEEKRARKRYRESERLRRMYIHQQYTQQELLKEALITEIFNKRSLYDLIRLEDEKKFVGNFKRWRIENPKIIYRDTLYGAGGRKNQQYQYVDDSTVSWRVQTITFSDERVYEEEVGAYMRTGSAVQARANRSQEPPPLLSGKRRGRPRKADELAKMYYQQYEYELLLQQGVVYTNTEYIDVLDTAKKTAENEIDQNLTYAKVTSLDDTKIKEEEQEEILVYEGVNAYESNLKNIKAVSESINNLPEVKSLDIKYEEKLPNEKIYIESINEEQKYYPESANLQPVYCDSSANVYGVTAVQSEVQLKIEGELQQITNATPIKYKYRDPKTGRCFNNSEEFKRIRYEYRSNEHRKARYNIKFYYQLKEKKYEILDQLLGKSKYKDSGENDEDS